MAVNLGKNSPLWLKLRHYAIPFLFVFGCPPFVIGLILLATPEVNWSYSFFYGDKFSWMFTLLFTAWCYTSLKISSKKFLGPTTSFGVTPHYVANGFQFFTTTLLTFLLLHRLMPRLSVTIYRHFPQIIGSLNVLALSFCFYLWLHGRRNSAGDPHLTKRMPFIFEFYRGMELHPRLWGVDVKQLVNCRIGLGLWTLLPVIFLLSMDTEDSGGIWVNVLLQLVYLGKFYWWETGYFNTLDITLDRAGFYLSWGCLNFVPTVYTFSTYYLVTHPSTLSIEQCALVMCIGLIFIYLNYAVDRQKEGLIQSKGRCLIWGKKAKCIEGNYQGRPVRLLISGYWGVARHLNYVFELLAALCWNLPCLGWGPLPFTYNFILLTILLHRIYRDEDKCHQKYGPYWKQYCQAVPYRLIPFVY